MRHLSMKQKKFLTKQSHISAHVLQQLEEMNDYETLYQDATRFHDDYILQHKQNTVYKIMNPQQAQIQEDEWLRRWK